MNIRLGLEVFLNSHTGMVTGKRTGLITHPGAIDHDLVGTVERLHPAVNLVRLFGPEHGLRGEAQAGEAIPTYTDSLTGLPVFSLYGKTRKPTPEMLDGLDVLIFDMQDAGARFYTYLSTLAYVMQAAAENPLPLIVLDRPALLNGLHVEGPVLDPRYASFVGIYPIPLRYGMTIGEMARLFNTAFSIGCDLTVMPLEGWTRSLWFDDTDLPFVPASPNLPTLTSLTLYPGTCLIEGTNISEGRGTTRPFEYIGAPWIAGERLAQRLNNLNLPGVRFRPVYFVPAFSKYQGELCSGVHIYVTNRHLLRPVEVGLHIIQQVIQQRPEQFAWREAWNAGERRPIDLLTGSSRVREHLDSRGSIADLAASWGADLQAFREMRESFLLYPQ
jgi:beta-N-acetylhexosaminidase